MESDTIHHLLLVAFSRANHAMNARTRDHGLMPGQPKVLEYLAGNEGCLQRDIARACEMDRATATGVLGRMEGMGLIERRPKAGDRRALEVWLTPAGWEAAECVARYGAEVDEIACTGLTNEERDVLARLLVRVRDNFNERGDDAHE